MNRRSFIGFISFGLTISSLLSSCRDKINQWILRIVLPNRNLGHRLLKMDFPSFKETIELDVLIIGGGISGLSAAYYLTQNNFHNFKIIELESKVGGNSRNGENLLTPYPLGAHYLPLPNIDDKDLITFLEHKQIIIGFDESGIPEIDQQYLSFSKQERLFIHNKWQDYILPKQGIDKKDEDEIIRFCNFTNMLQDEMDKDGRYYFDIPISNSSKETKYKNLDLISMSKWLEDNNYFSSYLLEHIDYCCRDDYGLGISEVSAYAGLCYFSSRKSKHWTKYENSVITSASGNGQLVNLLKEGLENNIISNSIVYNLELTDEGVRSMIFNEIENKSYQYISKRVIVTTPQFITSRLIPERKKMTKSFFYNPWIVATIILDRNGSINPNELAWDNVIYGGKGLGYIYAQHQRLERTQEDIVITYYYTLKGVSQERRRKFVYEKSKAYWENEIISDLEAAHFEIRKDIKEIEICIWGHGMISPRPGFIFSKELKDAREPIQDKVFFAHSDLSGISIFEEAFYQGVNAAKEIIKRI